MGSFAKALGQLAAKSMQSESAFILKTTSANKRGISLLLDATLRDGRAQSRLARRNTNHRYCTMAARVACPAHGSARPPSRLPPADARPSQATT